MTCSTSVRVVKRCWKCGGRLCRFHGKLAALWSGRVCPTCIAASDRDDVCSLDLSARVRMLEAQVRAMGVRPATPAFPSRAAIRSEVHIEQMHGRTITEGEARERLLSKHGRTRATRDDVECPTCRGQMVHFSGPLEPGERALTKNDEWYCPNCTTFRPTSPATGKGGAS